MSNPARIYGALCKTAFLNSAIYLTSNVRLLFPLFQLFIASFHRYLSLSLSLSLKTVSFSSPDFTHPPWWLAETVLHIDGTYGEWRGTTTAKANIHLCASLRAFAVAPWRSLTLATRFANEFDIFFRRRITHQFCMVCSFAIHSLLFVRRES